MDWKARAGRLKSDLPALFLALKRPETPRSAKVFAALWLLILFLILKAICF